MHQLFDPCRIFAKSDGLAVGRPGIGARAAVYAKGLDHSNTRGHVLRRDAAGQNNGDTGAFHQPCGDGPVAGQAGDAHEPSHGLVCRLIARFLNHRIGQKIVAERFKPGGGEATVCGLAVETDDGSGLAVAISTIRIGGSLGSKHFAGFDAG